MDNEQKKNGVVINKISVFINKEIIPLTMQLKTHEELPKHVSFLTTEEDTCRNALSIVKSELPLLLQKKELFFSKLSITYDRLYGDQKKIKMQIDDKS